MPSYNLVKSMNLGDLEDIVQSRNNLKIGPFVLQQSDNILINDGNIIVNEFSFKQSLENNTNITNYYLTSLDNNGTFSWSSNNPIPLWAQSFERDVSLKGFANDLDLVYLHSLCNVSFSGLFRDLEDEPTISQVIPQHQHSNFLRGTCNLSEFIGNSNAFCNLFDKMGLKSLAFKKLENTEVRDITVLENFYIYGECNQIDYLLMASDPEIYDDLADPTQKKKNTYKATWYNPFIDENNNVRDLFNLLDNYDISNTNSSVTGITLSNMHTLLYNFIQQQQQGFDIERVKTTMSNRMKNGEFLFVNSNLGESDLDDYICRSNLGLGEIAGIQGTNLHNVNKLQINNSVNMGSILTSSTSDEFFFKSTNDSGLVEYDELPIATSSSVGIIKLTDDFFSEETTKVISFDGLSNLIYELHSNIDQTILNVLNDLSQFENNDMFLEKTFSHFQLYPDQRSNAYENLQLELIAYNNHYSNLLTAPTTLHAFSNDIGILNAYGNCLEVRNAKSCRENLLCGSMSINDYDNCKIDGGGGAFHTLEINDTFTIKTSTSSSSKWGKNNINQLIWSDLYKATTDVKGLVKLLTTYETAAYDSVVTSKVLYDMYNVLNAKLNTIENTMNSLNIP